MGRQIFLSHSGIDAEAAAALKVRILAVPAAREHGLNVWLDKDDLRAGEPWQSQIEEAIGKSQAFAVYVGSKGMVNWVEAEVRLALNRAISEPEYRFVPILAAAAPGPDALPGFAQQFQAVFDVEARPDQFDRLMGAILGGADAGGLRLETDPFFGLRAIDEHRSHLFFGREAETDALVARVHRTPLVLVTGDSGSGKSSLVRAGLVPRFRGGALAFVEGARRDAIWHVVIARPRNQPFRQLGDAVDGAAKSLGLPLSDRGALADWAASGEIEKVRRGLRCDLPPERVQVLLVVDQFEELLTVTPPELRAPFIDLLLDLSDPAEGRHRVVLTMRHDYANLCNAYERLRERLDADDRRGRFLLGRMSDEGLRRVVTEPLRLAAVEPADREALARQVLRDVGERPGDLALVQMALTETWHARSRHGGDLLRAYIDVGRVEGALAKAAESVRANVLDDKERELLDSILLRLVRLGDTGGATRRVASRSEFDAARWSLVQKLTSDDGKRLVLVGGSSEHPRAEIAHEALVTAWPHFQGLLQQAPDDKRTLDALIPRAAAWAAHEDPHEREKRLATGADLELFAGLLHRRARWLSGDEREYVERSAAANKARERRRRLLFKGAVAASVLFLLVAMGAIFLFVEARALSFEARAERDRSERAARFASETLESLRATESLQPGEAVSLGLRALRSATEEQQELAEAALLRALFATRFRSLEGHAGAVNAVALSRDGARAVTGSSDACAIVWDLSNGRQVSVLRGHSSAIHAVDFDPEGRRVLTASTDGTARVWDAVTGEQVATAEKSEALVVAAFSPDGDSYATGSEGGAVAVRETMTGRLIVMLAGHHQRITALAFSSGGDRIVTASADGSVTVWQSRTGEMLLDLAPPPSQPAVTSAEFSQDRNFIVTASHDGRVRIWDSQDGHLQAERHSHQGIVQDVEFSPDGRLVVSAGDDGTALVWAWATDEVLTAFTGHQGGVYSVDFSADGRRVVSAADDGSARVWDATSGALEETVSWHEGTVWGAAFTPAGDAVVSWSADGKVNLSPRSVTSLVGHTGAVYTLALSPGHPVIATASADGTARLWSIADGAPLHVLGDQDASATREIWQAVFSPIGDRLITAGSDGDIQVWDTASGHLLQEDRRPGAPATDALFGPDGAFIVGVYGDGLVRGWPAGDLEGELEDLWQHGRAVQEVQFSPDGGVFLTISWDGTAILWDSATGKERHRLEDGAAALTSAAFSPDGQRVATASMDGTARIWHTASAELLTRLRSHGGPLAKVAFSSNGTRLATASWDNTARIWDAHTFEPLARLGGHRGRVQGVAFFGDGRIVATTSWDGSTRLWHVATGLQLAALEGHRGIIHAMAIGPDGSWLATASQDGTARLWSLPYVNGMDVEAAARDVLAGQAAHEPACTARQ